MDLFSQSLLYLAIFYVYDFFGTFPLNLPPGKRGWPIIGESLEYIGAAKGSRPKKFIADRTAKYSPEVCQTSLLGENLAVFCGASGNKFLFSGQNSYITTWWPSSMKKVLAFPETLEKLNRDDSKKMRSFLQEFLKPEALQHYIPIMDSMARDHLDTEWAPREEVEVFPLAKNYTFALACRLFMNIKDLQIVSKFAKPFARIAPGLISVPISLPGTPFSKAVRGGKQIREELLAIIRQRNKELLEGKDDEARDFLSRLLLEVSDKIVGLLFASHDMTSTSITVVVNFLAQFPDVYQRVYEEQMEIAKSKGPDELLNWDDIQKMKYSWNVACDSMRLCPPAQGSFREAITDFTFAGYTIPKGWKTFWTVYSTHKNPKYFSDPERFDPSRFEGDGRAPFTYVPFGGGPRMCPGKEYARLELLVFIHNLVTRFKIEKAIPDEKIIYNPSLVPANGLLIRLQTHN
ncbi:hypothetical protein ACJRO7_025908 [Eucalyptus globulus]|uniref:Cytochrome P450 n=1 Tax=Eucalyptus globulus TaxID=34317 RepID=A0ABD3KCI4_EUCGL